MRPGDDVSWDEITRVAYWRERLDEVGETATLAEHKQIDPLYGTRAKVTIALEQAIQEFRAHETIARLERADRTTTEQLATQHAIREATRQSANEARAARESARFSTTLTAIAAGAAVLALVASLAAYRLAFGDDEHDRRWRTEQRQLAVEQLRVLEEIRERLPAR